MEEKEIVVTPSGRVTTETDPEPRLEGTPADPADTAKTPAVNVSELEDLPVAYDQPGEEIDPALLDQYYEMAKQQAMLMRPRRYVPDSVHTKKHQTKAKRNSRNKLQKKSRKANRRKK